MEIIKESNEWMNKLNVFFMVQRENIVELKSFK